jgi:hypothetical protein
MMMSWNRGTLRGGAVDLGAGEGERVMLGRGWRGGVEGGLGEEEEGGGRSTLVHGVSDDDGLGPKVDEDGFDASCGGARWRRDV